MNEKLNNFLKNVCNDYFLRVHKGLVYKIGGDASIFYAFLCEQCKFFYDNNALTDEKYFFLTIEHIEKLLNYSRKKQDTCIKILIDNNLINIVKKGIPCKRFFCINDDLQHLQDNFINNYIEQLDFKKAILHEQKKQTTMSYENKSVCSNRTNCNELIEQTINNNINNNNKINNNNNTLFNSSLRSELNNDIIVTYVQNDKKNDNKKTQENENQNLDFEFLENEKNQNLNNKKIIKFIPPIKTEVFNYLANYCNEKNIIISNDNLNNIIEKFFTYYENTQWRDNRNKKIKNWKLKALMFLNNNKTNNSYINNKNLNNDQRIQHTIKNINSFVSFMQD